MQRHEVIAEQLIAIGWKPSCDAQWSKLKTWLESYDQPKPATGEQPGAEWIDSVMQTIEHDFHPEILDDSDMEIMRHIISRHAPATPAPKEVSARELISRVLKIRGEPGAYQTIDSVSLRQALDQLEAERAAKAKEPRA